MTSLPASKQHWQAAMVGIATEVVEPHTELTIFKVFGFVK
jgi:hypothetical protein